MTDSMTPEQALEDARTAAMGAAHHAYCHDTGCFDGDDISNVEIEGALDTLIAAAQRVARAEWEASLLTMAEARARLKLPDPDALWKE